MFDRESVASDRESIASEMIEEIQCDASPDEMMVKSSPEEATMARSGKQISFPTAWRACPEEDRSIPVEIEGERFRAMTTNGDGACSMHALWGTPLPSTTLPGEIELRDDDVRSKVLSNIPSSWQEACSLQNGRMRPRLEEWVDRMWKDLLDPQESGEEKRFFREALPVIVQQEASHYQNMLRERQACANRLHEKFAGFAAAFFVEGNEADLVRPLAYVCGYLTSVEVNVRNLPAEDPACATLENADSSLAILHACGEGKTKYQALFEPLQYRGATDFRAAFFHTADDDEGADRRQSFLEVFQNFGANPSLTQAQKDLVAHGTSILEELFCIRSLPTALPDSWTHEVAWAALWIALQQHGYWLNYLELQCLAACCSCRLAVHTYYWSGHPPVHHSIEDFGDMPGLTAAADVMLRLPSPEHMRGHFLRLLPDPTWQELIARLADRPGEENSNNEMSSNDEDAHVACGHSHGDHDMFSLPSGTSSDSSDTDSSDPSSDADSEETYTPTDAGAELVESCKQSSQTEQRAAEEDLMGPATAAGDDDEEEMQKGERQAKADVLRRGEKRKYDEVKGEAAVEVQEADEEDADVVQDDVELDDFSDVSDNSDIFHVAIDESLEYITVEDKDLQYIEELKEHLREYPLLPPEAHDASASHMEVDSGQRIPMCHCAFKGCGASTTRFPDNQHWGGEKWLFDHLMECHAGSEMADIYENCCQGDKHLQELTLLAYYMAAVREREREHLPLIGPSVDRRTLAMVHKLCRSENIHGMICFVCAQVHTHVACWDQMWKPPVFVGSPEEIKEQEAAWRADPSNRYRHWSRGAIQMWKVRDSLFAALAPSVDSEKEGKQAGTARDAYNLNLLRAKFMERFASPENKTDGPWQNAHELQEGDSEWQRSLRVGGRARGKQLPMTRVDRIMCCPEDVKSCGRCMHKEDEVCGECEVPLCHECMIAFRYSPHVIPMGLCNDNLWGCTTSVISKYQVRWLEAAIVSPAWTSMMVFYVEGDGGHLFDEKLNEQRWRTMVRGSCVSYTMPWEDILRELRENCEDSDLCDLPRKGACLKYLMRVHLNVAGRDMDKHIKALKVRPFVLIKLLEFLIDNGHEAFQGKGSPQDLKAKMRAAVAKEYIETEGHLPEELREGQVPDSIATALREMEETRRQEELEGKKWSHRLRLFRTKNSTPGDGASCVSKCTENIRPMAMCMDRNDNSLSKPADTQAGAWQGFGTLHVQTGSKWLSQWCPRYFSQVLPFVIPRMVSGADFREESEPWRRQKFADAPRVSVQAFVQGFARRVEASCRTDWTALPILRSVSHKFTAEHTMSTLANFCGKKGWTTDTRAAEFVKAAQNLYHYLHHGTIGTGVHRVPIAGDTSKLPLANGLTALEKRLAWAQHFLARHMPGSQQLRQVMGHAHFGARIVYGDCIFFTISPNEQHSCLTLRLSRFRKNDPYVKHKDALWRRLAQQDFPALERKRHKRLRISGKRNEMDIELELPEYDIRKLATARDPLAVIEAYRVEVLLRLATLLGVRMCPQCPSCNQNGLGCQDRFGSNMRPMGGVMGGMNAFGGATEHQGNGTPHLHAEGHVVCAYQYDTMFEIAEKFRQQKITVDAWMNYNGWLHREAVFDEQAHENFKSRVDAEFFQRFSAAEHNDMSAVPEYLVQDAANKSTSTVSNVESEEQKAELHQDGVRFLKDYYSDAQFIFNRVQHHCHQKTANGYVPFKSCRVKGKGKVKASKSLICKAGFPMKKLIMSTPLLVCRGLAKKYGLRVTGRRNRLSSMIGKRQCEWQSGTHPAFAVVFRSNTHTLPNYRAPLTAETHEDKFCRSKACKSSFQDPKAFKNLAKIAQRACRECTGYHSGYTFKRQPIGVKYLDAASDTLNYVTEGMESKTANQKYHYITHRMLQDTQHRCIARTTPEEWNLAANWNKHDVKSAEFMRTYMNKDFQGSLLLRRHEAERSCESTRNIKKQLPAKGDSEPAEDLYLRCFDDVYGFRARNLGKGRHLYFLNPWEFLMLWECKRLPPPPSPLSCKVDNDDYEPNPDSESDDVIFFPEGIPGEMNLRNRWYLSRRARPMIPAPSGTPLPDQAKNASKKFLLYSLYMRPWTLHTEWASTQVPHITDLDVLPHSVASMEHATQAFDAECLLSSADNSSIDVRLRSHELSWRWYIRGHVVSRHAQRLIVQFMAACCGRSNGDDGQNEEQEAREMSKANVPDNDLSLQRVHNIIDSMSREEEPQVTKRRSQVAKEFPEDNPEEEMPADPDTSDLVKEALVATGKLWKREIGEAGVWQDADKRHSSLDENTLRALSVKAKAPAKKKSKKKKRKVYQQKAYSSWNEEKCTEWWAKLKASDEPPTEEQESFLRCVETRCRQERKELEALERQQHSEMIANKAQQRKRNKKKIQKKTKLSEPLRACLFGLPGAGKSTCIKYLRSYFQDALGWEDGVEFQFLASQNTMASLIGGQTLHHWSTIPVNAKTAGEKKLGKGAEGDIDALFLKAQGMRWIIIDEASTASLTILDLLDSYLRRACSRHPYACQGRQERPFGGINFIFSGDLWQLPPVKGKAIFGNPFRCGLTAGEQKIAKIFWMIKDPIHRLFELTMNKRANDDWLKAMLEADRAGAESWEIYCFVHGLPTRNPGSWLPQLEAPSCGKAECQKLAEKWQEYRNQNYRISWALRQTEECGVCQAHRQRRCCIIEGNARNFERYQSGAFADAPFVHPFRAPSYHAQHLRSIAFAKNNNRRLLWVTAFDKLMNVDSTWKSEQGQQRKEKWLEYHERFTNGIPGLLPLVVDLPIRFTDAPSPSAREQGIFKHARGILRGWQLESEELERVEQQADVSEVVLQRRPTQLLIEVPTANAKLPSTNGKKIFALSICMKTWSLDRENKVPVKRYGFPIVPDFGGTAHAYCGDTLRACIGDLMKWNQTPTMEQALRALIIKSRVRDANNLLLAQPYSPMLLRQGVQPGPQLLLNTLQKVITPKEAKARWEAFEVAQKEEEKAGSHWQDRIQLPCRRCSDRQGHEVMKPLRAFPMPGVSDPKAIWITCIAEGQDLNCFLCRRALWKLTQHKQSVDPGLHCIYCSTCDVARGFEYFSAADKQAWRLPEESDQEFHCLPCLNQKPITNTDEAPKHLCLTCEQILPYYHFVPAHLSAWKHQGTVEQAAQCARCYTQKRTDLAENVRYTCKLCDKTKHIRDFDCVTIRSWMDGKRGGGNKWSCYDCHYPPCGFCDQRPMHAVAHNSWVSREVYYKQANKVHARAADAFAVANKRWFCVACKYPPCASQLSSVCSKTRLSKRELRFLTWTCKSCTDAEAEHTNPAIKVQEKFPEWHEKFKKWQEFYEAYGQDPPSRTVTGKWIRQQRLFLERLPEDKRIERLWEDKKCLLHKVAKSKESTTKKAK